MKKNIFKISKNSYIYFKRKYKNTYNLFCPFSKTNYAYINNLKNTSSRLSPACAAADQESDHWIYQEFIIIINN